MQLSSNTLMKFSSRSIFIHYAIPSVIGIIMSSTAVLVDGMFVARFISPNAFAAINIIWPVTALTFGIYVMFIIGSVAIAGKYIGRGNIKRANLLFSQTVIIANIAAIIPLVTVYIFKDKILPVLGAHEEIFYYAMDYLPFLLLGCFFNGFSFILYEFAKLDGSPKFVSFVLVIGSLSNIILDFVFIVIFKMGVTGAAFATCLSHILAFIFMSTYFLRKNTRIKFIKIYGGWGYSIKAAANGFSEFLNETSNGLIPWLFNITIYQLAGNGGILAYAVANYAFSFFGLISYALGDSLQPLISISFGARKECKMRAFLKIAIFTISSIASLLIILFLTYPEILVNILLKGVDIKIYNWSVFFLRMRALSFIFVGINIIMSAYYTSVQCAGASAIIASLRTLILPILLLIILPKIFGFFGLALVLTISEIATLFVSIMLFKKRKPSILLSADTI